MLTATCGACKGKHETIAEYRNCSGAPQTEAQVMDNLTGQTTTANPPSDAQIKYALDLLENRVWPDGFCEEDLRGMERKVVSNLIDSLHKAPRKGQDRRVGAKGSKVSEWKDIIPKGRYALVWQSTKSSGWKFYQVRHGHTRTFVVMLLGSPGAYREVKLNYKDADTVLKEIERVTPQKASADFGQQSGTCGVCSSPLTNEESLKYGIGPKCRSKMGW